jgi:hypothetical protein
MALEALVEDDDNSARIKELEKELAAIRSKYEKEEERHHATQAQLTILREKSDDSVLKEAALQLTRSTSDCAVAGGKESERMQKLVNDKRKLALEVATLKDEKKRAEERCTSLSTKLSQLEGAASSGAQPAPKPGARGRQRAATAASKSEEGGAEEEVKALKARVKQLEADGAAARNKAAIALENALRKGETWQLQLKAAEKAAADAEKKVASLQVRCA